MEKKLQQFLDEVFAPYGNFPARTEVTKELLANLVEKYHDLKQQGMSEDEAYQATIDSFGDVEEIMEQIPHTEKNPKIKREDDASLRKTLKKAFRHTKLGLGASRFTAVNLKQSDLVIPTVSEGNVRCKMLYGVLSLTGSDLRRSNVRAIPLKNS